MKGSIQMRFNKKLCLGIAASLVALVSVPQAVAQRVGDFATYGATSSRTGNNGNAANTGPGATNLRWHTPNGTNFTNKRPVIDDTDTNPPTLAADGSPFLPNPYGFTFQTGPAWGGATDGPNDTPASPNITEDVRTTNIVYNGVPYQPDFDEREPIYHFASCASSAPGPDPTVPAAGAAAVTKFSWQFTGIDANPRTFGIWVNIPAGPTLLAATNVKFFPQEFYVFTIDYGPNFKFRYTDVVDTYLSGGGWIRLGAGGMPNNVVFPYDGTDPIRVTLYNTVPRHPDGTLSMPTNGVSSGDPMSQWYVYADAVRFDAQPGQSLATPTATRLVDTDPTSTVVVHANNMFTSGETITTSNGVTNDRATTPMEGVVTSYNFGTGVPRWSYSPLQEGPTPVPYSNVPQYTHAPFALDQNGAIFYTAPEAATAAIVDGGLAAATGTVEYHPALTGQQTYNIYVYIPGNDANHSYGQSVNYTVTSKDGTFVYQIDQSQPQGWVRLGNVRFTNDPTNPITVDVTNSSTLTTDDGKLAYANAMRFVGEVNDTISSSPVHASVMITPAGGGTPVLTKVVVVADENGYIHCLDEQGNGDGTTNEYWSYPSLKDGNGLDPNLGAPGAPGTEYNGPDLTPAAQRDYADRPQGFGLSTGLVVRQNAGTANEQDYFVIGNSNGRVYSINMAGRGDFGSIRANQRAGTTTRAWTFPATFPSKQTFPASELQSVVGSVAFGSPNGVDTIYVPTQEGRIFAINAESTNGDESTNQQWTFPLETDPHLGPITTAPLVAYGSIYFGTQVFQTSIDNPGRFIKIDAGTGAFQAEMTTGITPNPLLSFTASPCTASNHDLDTTNADTTAGLVYVINQDNEVYALDSGTLAIDWQTNELNSNSTAALTFSWLSVYDNTGLGTQVAAPTVLVPTVDGRFVGLFARTADVNIDGTKRDWGFDAQADNVYAGIAVQGLDNGTPSTPTGWMYAADGASNLYAFNNDLGELSQGDEPGSQEIVENDPRGQVFRKAKVRLITRPTYQSLRQPTGANLTYQQATASPFPGTGTPPFGYEWGQTVYVMVYDFPFYTTNNAAPPTNVDPPVVNISFNVAGKIVRGVAVQSRQFNNPTGSPTFNNTAALTDQLPNGVTDPAMDGYAILAFPLQSSGANSLPPGAAQIGVSITTSSLNGNQVQQNVVLNPAYSQTNFDIANPLAIMVADTGGGALQASGSTGLPSSAQADGDTYAFGLSNNPLDPENLGNGSFNVGGKLASLLASSAGTIGHGSSGKTIVYIVDRSMMSLLRPLGLTQGLDNVRVSQPNLAWEGGATAVLKPLDTTYCANYVGFEDMPVNSPNNSFDYPDIHQENVTAIANPNTAPDNPLFFPVTLLPPLDSTTIGSTSQGAMDENTNPLNRIFRATPFELDISVPRFQPPNLANSSYVTDSTGANKPTQGYLGRLNVFVDSIPNGRLDTAVAEAYRSVNLMNNVAPDERLSVTTPTVDLGSLPGGAGYTTAFQLGTQISQTQASPNNMFQPWGTGNYTSIFKPFGVQNEGNVNLLSLRLAKVANFNGTATNFTVPSSDVDMSAYLDATFDVWSTLDTAFSPGPDKQQRVFLQKARVQDRIPTSLVPNPVKRANQNLNVTGTKVVNGVTIPDVLNPAMVNGSLLFDPTKYPQPVIGVSVPIGFPVGKYATVPNSVRVFEDENPPAGVWTTYGPSGTAAMPFTDPGLELSFNVSETRLTNSYLPNTEKMIDDLLSPSSGPFANANIQPAAARDIFGSMLVAWSSNRPSMTTSIQGPDNNQYRIYVSSLGTGASFPPSQNGSFTSPGLSPIRDLDNWTSGSGGAWFQTVAAGLPTVPASTLFGLNTGETLIAGSDRYGNPAFPTAGSSDPYTFGNNFTGLYMGFTGEVQRQNPDNTVQHESRLFLTTVAPTATGGSVGSILALQDDALSIKGRPTIVQTGGANQSKAIVFYPVTSAGKSSVLYTRFDGAAFASPQALPFGAGFTAISSPSAAGRMYARGSANQNTVVELTFQGKLRGRPYPETFLGRLIATGPGGAATTAPDRLLESANGVVSPNVFMPLPAANEQLQAETGSTGLYRAAGVQWDVVDNLAGLQTPFTLMQAAGGPATNLLVAGSTVYDRQTGIISCDTVLGGKVYLDPTLGTVRFTGAVPAQSAQLLLSYTPRFLRISSGGATGYTDPVGLYDSRLISDPTYWRTTSGAQADTTTQAADGNLLSNDRIIFTYTGGAVSTSQAARPYVKTMRFGVRLPYRIPTLSDGTPGVAGYTGSPVGVTTGDAYQLDPTQGTTAAIYFPESSEGRTVTINQWASDAAGNVILDGNGKPMVFTTTATVSLIAERDEAPLPIETSINEAGLVPFLDPFSYNNASPNGAAASRRPPLLFMVWSSTRYGSPDLFLESIAPRWTPVAIGH